MIRLTNKVSLQFGVLILAALIGNQCAAPSSAGSNSEKSSNPLLGERGDDEVRPGVVDFYLEVLDCLQNEFGEYYIGELFLTLGPSLMAKGEVVTALPSLDEVNEIRKLWALEQQDENRTTLLVSDGNSERNRIGVHQTIFLDSGNVLLRIIRSDNREVVQFGQLEFQWTGFCFESPRRWENSNSRAWK